MGITIAYRGLTTPVGMCKVGTILLGAVILGLGLHSHYDSTWKQYELYRICDRPEVTKCPSIAWEYYYVYFIIFFFVTSLVGLVITVTLPDFPKRVYLNKVDLRCHRLAAVLLLIVAVIYMVSAQQINNLFANSPKLREMLNLRYEEKMAAGVLTVVQAILYGITAFLMMKNRASEV